MIHLYLVRHAAAVEGSRPDELRPLIGKARKRFRKIARTLARRGGKLDAILTSPLVRAVQTAEILAAEVRHGEVDVLDELAPGHTAEALLRAVARRAGKRGSWALVGHEPQLSSVVAALAHLPPAQSSRLDLRSGGVVRIDVTDLPAAKNAQPKWWLKPRSGARKKGLPLQEPAKAKPASKKAAPPKRKAVEAKKPKPPARKARAPRTPPNAAPSAVQRKKPVAAAKPAPPRAPAPRPALPRAPAPKPRQPETPAAPQKFMGTPRPATPPAAPAPPDVPPPGAAKPGES